MAADFNLNNQFISESYQRLFQISGSIPVDGTGSAIESLTVTASLASTASFVESASFATSASYAVSASLSDLATQATNSTSASRATSAANADNATTASFALTASLLLGSISSASYATFAEDAQSASFASTASFATSASHALNADDAISSSFASTSISASHAVNADIAITASYVETAQTASHAAASDVTFDDADFQFTASNVQQALDILDNEKANLDQLSSNVNLYPTTASSDIGGYFVLVENSSDSDYVQGGANVATGTITGQNQLIASLAVKENVFSGNPGILNITTQGQIRRTGGGGFSSADFYYEIYERIGAVETLIATSDTTREVNEQHYEEFNASAVIPERDYASNGRIVLKFYGNLVSGIGGNPSFDFLFGGTTPVRSLFPVPATLLVSPWNGQFEGNAGITGSLNVSADVTASNFLGTASIASDLTSNANININQITASTATFTSASIGYLESITGSAKIIGDAFIILNADTPTQPYAGIKVYDSGSTNATASIEWDGEDDNWIIIEESGDSGVVLTGPTGSKGSEILPDVNVLQKGGGHHSLIDSSITDDGTTVSTTLPISSSGTITANAFIGDGSGLTNVSPASSSYAVSASFAQTASYVETAQTASFVTASNVVGLITSASHALNADDAISASYAPTNTADANTWTNTNTFNSQVHGGVTALTIASTTASLDMQDGNFFTLTLSNGTDTHLDATNVTAGQTITLVVTNNATAAGTLSFSPDFKFAEGTAPTVTDTTSAIDVLTFVTTDSTNVFGTSLLNFS